MNGTLTIRFFGVGDGDCILIELPDGRLGLIDSNSRPGRGESPALEFLRGKPLAFCVLTHPHADHCGGMLEVLQAAKIPKSEREESTFWYAMSDLDKVFEDLNQPIIVGEDNELAESERQREIAYLFDLFEWMRDNCPHGFTEPILNVAYKGFGDVHVTVVGPSGRYWDRYTRYLARQRKRNQPASTQYANRISITILIRYAGRLVWLLGDLTGPPLRSLDRRVELNTPPEAFAGVKASVLKVAHHGASNGWYPELAERLTNCDPGNVIVFSANGSQHPDPEVAKKWGQTGKQIATTWVPSGARAASADFGGWAADGINAVSDPAIECPPQDVVVTIDAAGNVEYERAPV